ncbi:MAG: hypothetical protein V1895_02620, partial [Parcubacteria group bacterium]
LLAPLTIFLLLLVLFREKRTMAIVMQAVLMVTILSFVFLPSYGRGPFGKQFFDVILPRLPDTQALVVMTGGTYSYLIPFFPEKYRFVRIDGNLFGEFESVEKIVRSPFAADKIVPVIQQHSGPFFTLRDKPAEELLKAFGLREDTQRCQAIQVRNHRKTSQWCPLEKLI